MRSHVMEPSGFATILVMMALFVIALAFYVCSGGGD
jgi:hypothetical protein